MTSSSFFALAEDELKLLLHYSNKESVLQIAENVDWESCQKKYSEILDLFKTKYASSEERKRMGILPS